MRNDVTGSNQRCVTETTQVGLEIAMRYIMLDRDLNKSVGAREPSQKRLNRWRIFFVNCKN